MDVWNFANPLLRVLLYLASCGAVGTAFFIIHFKKYQNSQGLGYYCQSLMRKSAVMGVLVSLALFFSIAGNIGGNLISAFDALLLQLALETKSGVAVLMGLMGFFLISLTAKTESLMNLLIVLAGSAFIIISFLMVGHSLQGGLVTQSLLLMHLVGVVFWLGSFLPFRWLCIYGEASSLYSIAHRFGVLAMGYVCFLVLAGLIFAYTLLGDVSQLVVTNYGNVFLAKLFAVSLLLSLGALNKLRLVPVLLSHPLQGVKQFRFSVQLEMAIAFLILLLSAFLTTSLTPPINM